MSTTPPEGQDPNTPLQPTTPPGYEPGQYVPFSERDPNNPSPVAGQGGWSDQARQQAEAQQAAGGPNDPYRAVYGYDAPPRVHYASWGKRVLAYLVDSFFGFLIGIPAYIGYVMLIGDLETTTDVYGNPTLSGNQEISAAAIGLIALGVLLSMAFWIWNLVIRQGSTGYSLGKTALGIKLVGDQSMAPVGPAMSFLRQLAHIVDGLICNIGYLWPIWDERNQTLGDKIVSTIVIVEDPPAR
ncbi:RDD family protein [Nocardioides sp.]|uniref:RDD family protein n=1 Tax=Nocardioides sp. TaxID=35761 RepID=UPI0035699108